MELKEGMYVRFDWKKQQIPILIGKITEVYHDEDEKYYFYSTDNGLIIGEDNFVKEPSNNLIDLIEVGDYVNGVEVIDKEVDNLNEEYLQCGVGDYVICTYEVKDIKSIVTKEQFESMSYHVVK